VIFDPFLGRYLDACSTGITATEFEEPVDELRCMWSVCWCIYKCSASYFVFVSAWLCLYASRYVSKQVFFYCRAVYFYTYASSKQFLNTVLTSDTTLVHIFSAAYAGIVEILLFFGNLFCTCAKKWL